MVVSPVFSPCFAVFRSLSTCAKGQTVERDLGRVAIPQPIYRPPEPEDCWGKWRGSSERWGERRGISSMHPSRDVIFVRLNFGPKTPKIISVHYVWEPLKQAL